MRPDDGRGSTAARSRSTSAAAANTHNLHNPSGDLVLFAGLSNVELRVDAPNRVTHRRQITWREDRVITLTDLIGFSDLTEAEVQAIARHEHVTSLEAVFLGGQLMQSPTGQN